MVWRDVADWQPKSDEVSEKGFFNGGDRPTVGSQIVGLLGHGLLGMRTWPNTWKFEISFWENILHETNEAKTENIFGNIAYSIDHYK